MVEVLRCRCSRGAVVVQRWCRGAEVQRRCRVQGAGGAEEEVQRWCIEQRCRGAESRGAEESAGLWIRSAGAVQV
jgi:hypothetical protein